MSAKPDYTKKGRDLHLYKFTITKTFGDGSQTVSQAFALGYDNGNGTADVLVDSLTPTFGGGEVGSDADADDTNGGPDGAFGYGRSATGGVPGDISAGRGRITFGIPNGTYGSRVFTDPRYPRCNPCGGADIFLAYVGPDSGVTWIQSVTVNGNQHGDSQPGAAPFYVDVATLAQFTRGTTVYFGDDPGRPLSGDYTWQAQTSAVVPNGSGGYTALATFSWGFTIHGGQVTLMPFTVVAPNSFQQGLIGGAH